MLKVLVLVCVSVLVGVGLTLASVMFISQDQQNEVCRSEGCYDAAKHILKWMDPSVEPCDDFYYYACGNWRYNDATADDQPLKESMGSKGEMVSYYLKSLLSDPPEIHQSRLFGLLKQLLILCMDEKTLSTRGVSPVLGLLQKVGGWPLLEQAWSADKWTVQDTELTLAQYGLGNSLFTVAVAADWKSSERYVLAVDVPPFSDGPDSSEFLMGLEDEVVQRYFQRMCNVSEMFGASKVSAEPFLREILQFEENLAKIKNATEDFEDDRLTLETLQRDVPWMDWARLLRVRLPESLRLGSNDTILVRSQYLKQLEGLLNKYPKRTVANYMMWKAASSLTSLLTPEMLNMTSTTPTVSRYQHCVQGIKKSSLSVALVSYLARVTRKESQAAFDMTQQIKEELLQSFEELTWVDKTTGKDLEGKILNLTLEVGFPAKYLDLKTLEDYYKEFRMNSTHYFEAMLDGNKWIKSQKFTKLGKALDFKNWNEEAKEHLDITAMYFYFQNSIQITGPLLHTLPLFKTGNPSYVNYGQLGWVIAHELIHLLDMQSDPLKGAEENNVTMAYWKSEESKEIYEEKKQCVIDLYSSFNDTKTTKMKINGTKTVRENIADISGFKLALRVYRRLAKNMPSPEPKLPMLEHLSSEKLFMISVANTFCQVPEREKLIKQLTNFRYPHALWEFRVKGIAMNSPAFSELFGCAAGESMNPVAKCSVW